MNTSKQRVLAGIRATGRLHLGNYLGSIKGMLELQNDQKYEPLYMVADAHAITTPYSVDELRINRREVIIDYLTAGLDPEKSILFLQSMVSEHYELAFYFSSVTTVAKMQHLPTFKDKVKQYPEHVTMALLNYPMLMASDILLYNVALIPAGLDQEPHIEVAREVARRMNQDYGSHFVEPKRFETMMTSVPSLTGEGKMSKSVEGSYINLMDSQDEIVKKIRSVPTSTSVGGEMSPGVNTLFALLKIVSPDKVDRFLSQYNDGSLRFVELKDVVAEAIYLELKPFQERRKEIEQNTEYVDKVIEMGAQKARTIAKETVREVKLCMGLA